MLDKVEVTCPYCGARQYANNIKNKDSAEVHCCRCNESILVFFNTDETIYSASNSEPTVAEFCYNGRTLKTIALNADAEYCIGRKPKSSSSPQPDIPIDTSDDNSVSRKHCKIEIKKLKGGKSKIILSDIREDEKIEKLKTKINEVPLLKGERIVLQNNDRIQMGRQVIEFKLK